MSDWQDGSQASGAGGDWNSGGGNTFAATASAGFEKSGDNRGCYNCGEDGHTRDECTKPTTCKGCGQEGHMRKDCPQQGPTKCYRCGEEGHFSSECSQPQVCKECGAGDHISKDCPDRVCKNCGEKGHTATKCEGARKVDRDEFPDMSVEDAWILIKEAAKERDIDDLKHAIQCYVKASPETTYAALEGAFRGNNIDVYLIALERTALCDVLTNMDLQGNLGKKYTINYRFDGRPARPRERELWPTSSEENMERLEDAGDIVPRGIPKCLNCKELGHISKSCPQEKQVPDIVATIKCFNCDQEGHRVRDCPTPRVDKFACKNCGQGGHKIAECPEPPNMDLVECRKCNETGHYARDCPQGGGSRGCRNCGQEGHMAKECTEPRNMANFQCRNCDEMGHAARDCDKPRDMSRVVCSNCQEKGHFKSRCQNPTKEEEGDGGNGDGFDNAAGFDNSGGGFDGANDFASSGNFETSQNANSAW